MVISRGEVAFEVSLDLWIESAEQRWEEMVPARDEGNHEEQEWERAVSVGFEQIFMKGEEDLE